MGFADPATLLAAALILFIAYFIRGISGFGSGLVAVPLLAHFFPLTFVVPLVLVTDFFGSVVLTARTRQQVRWDELRPLLPFGVLGVVAGTTLLLQLPRTPLLVTLGFLVLFFGIRSALNIQGHRKVSRLWAAPAGLMGGTISALFGTGGPPYVIYLSHRLRDKGVLRGTFSALFLIEGGARLGVFLIAGLFASPHLLQAIVASLPVVALGLWAGNHVHVGISHTGMQRTVGGLLVASGGSLLVRALS